MKSCIFALALFVALVSAQDEAATTEVCELPAEVGMCRAAFTRYHYNNATKTCELFIWGGCGGNANNFNTIEECMNHCQPDAETEPPLVRCPRLPCDGICEFGFTSDERGCPTCDCKPQPCTTKVCAENEKCILDDYEEATCIAVIKTVEEGGTDDYDPEEVAPTPPCPLVMCMMYCQFDFAKDPETGCAKCECNDSPCLDNECGEDEICKAEKISDVWTASCITNLTNEPIKQHGPVTGAPPADDCPIQRCYTQCDFGNMKDENGCSTCECKMHPCDGETCPAGQVCKPLEVQCFDLPCPMQPNCVLQPLCLGQKEQILGVSSGQSSGGLLGEDSWSRPPQERPASDGLLGGDSWSRPPAGDGHVQEPSAEQPPMLGQDAWSRPPLPWAPECTENGDFKPRQCNGVKTTCWCVDDRGVKIDGSSRNITPGVIPPVCAFNQTTALHGKFQMSHDIDDIDNHLDNIQELTHQSLSEWLLIERDYIEIIEIRPYGADVHILEVDFYVRADQLGYHDLATSSYHLQDQAQQGQLQMDYGEHTLKPKPDSLQIDHEFSPVLPSTGLRPNPNISGCYFYENHKTAIIAGLLGLGFFLLVLIVLLKMVIAKKRLNRTLKLNQPGDKYRENLAFSNQLYGKVTDEEKVVLPNVEFTANSEAIA